MDEKLQLIAEHQASAKSTLTIITGPACSGKTTLLREYVEGHGSDRSLYVPNALKAGRTSGYVIFGMHTQHCDMFLDYNRIIPPAIDMLVVRDYGNYSIENLKSLSELVHSFNAESGPNLYRPLYHNFKCLQPVHIICIVPEFVDFSCIEPQTEREARRMCTPLIIHMDRIARPIIRYDLYRRHQSLFAPVLEEIVDVSYWPPCPEIPVMSCGGFRYREGKERFERYRAV